MRRRQFITLLGGAAAGWPLMVSAQQADRPRQIGVLSSLAESDAEGQARFQAFQQGLEQLGWKAGDNVRIEYRWAAADADRLRTYAAELVAMKPNVLFASTSSVLAKLQRETRDIPIVFAQVTDPVSAGFITSLAHPGGNITGFALYEYGLAVKWLELLKQIAPRIAHAAVIYEAGIPQSAGYLREIDGGASSFGLSVSKHAVRGRRDIEGAFEIIAREASAGLIVLPGPVTAVHRDVIIRLAAERRLPNVYPYRHYPASGGLASYGVDNNDSHRRAAGYVDRILKGEKPANLPVQLADKFLLVINLKTAKTLGLDVPLSLLARTDEVIE